MRRADQITGIVMLVFSITVAYSSWQMPQRVEFGPGMGFLPFWLAVIMAVLSVLLLLDASGRKRKGIPGPNPFPAPRALLNVVQVIVGLGIYVAIIEKVGFSVSTVLFIAFLLAVVQRERWLKTAVVSLLSTGGLYLIFQILLEVKLPKNIYGF